jgi:hypothetical protein
VLDELVLRELSTAEQVLVVKARALEERPVTRVDEVDHGDTPAGGFDAALWECEHDVVSGLRRLRQRVKPGGLLLVSVPRPGALDRLKRMFAAGEGEAPDFEALCAAPLLVGLLEPRVVVEEAKVALVAARVPDPLDALDALFTQPS